MLPNLKEERRAQKKGHKRVFGIDEAGRGALAGPVVAAAARINQNLLTRPIDKCFKEVKDSKKLTSCKREKIYKILTRTPEIEWRIGIVSEKIIDRINIKNAAELAMEKAIKKLKIRPDFLIIDGKYFKNQKIKTINHKLIVRADEKVFSCSCASILAKVTRDRLMRKLDRKYSYKYRFFQHKGYCTRLHLRMLKKYGPCKIHRKTFGPVVRYQITEHKYRV